MANCASVNAWRPVCDTVVYQASYPEVATEGQTLFSQPEPYYTVGNGSLVVYKNGLKLTLGADYTEVDSRTFELTSPATISDFVDAVAFSGTPGASHLSDLDFVPLTSSITLTLTAAGVGGTSDVGKFFVTSGAANIVITVPLTFTEDLGKNFTIALRREGTGTVSFVGEGATNIIPEGGTSTSVPIHGTVQLGNPKDPNLPENTWILYGNLTELQEQPLVVRGSYADYNWQVIGDVLKVWGTATRVGSNPHTVQVCDPVLSLSSPRFLGAPSYVVTGNEVTPDVTVPSSVGFEAISNTQFTWNVENDVDAASIYFVAEGVVSSDWLALVALS